MRSLFNYFAEESVSRETTSRVGQIIITPEEEQEEMERCRRMNDKWNAESAAMRQERLAIEREKRHERILQEVEARAALDEENFEFAENMVRHEKEQSSTFILPEQIDAAIEEALANPTDFNYAIDLKQNVYYGRRTATKPAPLPDGRNNAAEPLKLEGAN